MERKFTIKQARQYKGLTQKQLSEKLGISESTLNKYEKYETPMRMDTAFKLSESVNIAIDDIIFLPKNYGNSVVKA